jgi:hypothetical protein
VSEPLEPLSASALAALDAERARPPPAAETLARLAARLETIAPAAATTATAATALTKAKLMFLVAGLGLGGAGGALVGFQLGRDARPSDPPPPPVVGAPQQAFAVERPVVELVPVEVARPAPEAASPPAVAAVANVPAPPPPNDSEQLLIERATAALMRGRAEQALGVCAQLDERFPEGELLEERRSLEIRALVALGRRAEAEARAAAFRSRFPGSLLIPVVDEALEQP